MIYFGPGVHEVSHLEVGSGKTVYVAGGAVVRGVIGPDEPFRVSSYQRPERTYRPTFDLRGSGITLRGRGIIDGSALHDPRAEPAGGRKAPTSASRASSSAIRAPGTMPIRQSDRVTVQNVKILGYRANSDGIDICNSRDVTVEAASSARWTT